MKSPTLASVRAELRAAADPAKAAFFPRFFRTGKGEYGEGDTFIGVTVPRLRVIAAANATLADKVVDALLRSKVHEERLLALLLLVRRFAKGDADVRCRVYDYYLRHAERVNNWDLVDSSSYHIVGEWLRTEANAAETRRVLTKLARSENLWRRRIAMVSTMAFIRKGDLQPTFMVATLLLRDKHDLMHKAVGWLLREAGKKDHAALVAFLAPVYRDMPRTMLRYAIERFPETQRKRYLAGTA